MRKIMNISGTCPAHINPRKLPIRTKVDTVLILKDRILLVCMNVSAQHSACAGDIP